MCSGAQDHHRFQVLAAPHRHRGRVVRQAAAVVESVSHGRKGFLRRPGEQRDDVNLSAQTRETGEQCPSRQCRIIEVGREGEYAPRFNKRVLPRIGQIVRSLESLVLCHWI